MRWYKLVAFMFLVSMLCSCNRNSGAHEYNGNIEKENEKLNNTSIVSERMGESLGFHNISSCYSYEGNVYSFFLEEDCESKLYSLQEDGKFKEIKNEYNNIDQYLQLEDKMYLHCYDANGFPVLARIDANGETESYIKADYCEGLFSNGETIFFVSLDYDDSYLITEYDLQLNVLQEYNISKKICSEKQLITGIKYYNDSFYMLIANGISNRDDENISGINLVRYNIKTSEIDQILDLNTIVELENFSDFYISQEEIRIVCHEKDNYIIRYLDLNSRKLLKESAPFSADRVFDSGYSYDGILYNYDNTMIFDDDTEVVDYSTVETKSNILTYERKSIAHIYITNEKDLTIEDETIVLFNNYDYEGCIAKNNENIILVARDVESECDSVLTIDKYGIAKDVLISEISILDIDSNEDEVIYISDENVYKKSLLSDENPLELNVKGKPLSLGKDKENKILLITEFDGEVVLYKYANGLFNEMETLDITSNSDKIEIINGNNEAEFFIQTSESIFKYNNMKLESIIDIEKLNAICEISGIGVINSDEFIIIGRNRKTYAIEIYDVNYSRETNRNIIEVAVESDIEFDIYEIISEYNKIQTDNVAILTEIGDDIYNTPDIYIYSPKTDVNKYISNQMLIDLSTIIGDENLLPVFTNNNQVFSTFYIRQRKNKDKDDDSNIKYDINASLFDFIDFDLDQLYDSDVNKYNFSNPIFYHTLGNINQKKVSYEYIDYRNIQDILSKWDNNSNQDYVIEPYFLISIFDSLNSSIAFDLTNFIMNYNYSTNEDYGKCDNLSTSKEYYLEYSKKYKINESEINKILDIISSGKTIPIFDENLYNILYECTTDYCESNVSEESIAERVNKRINLYLDERK